MARLMTFEAVILGGGGEFAGKGAPTLRNRFFFFFFCSFLSLLWACLCLASQEICSSNPGGSIGPEDREEREEDGLGFRFTLGWSGPKVFFM